MKNNTINHELDNPKAEDYIFRFKLKTNTPNQNPENVLLEFYQEQLADLLQIIFLSRDGEKLLPNEFGFLNEPDKKFPLFKGQGK